MSEDQAEYTVEVNRESAFDGRYVRLWIEKLWPSVELKSRGSKMQHGYTLFPLGQLVVKFELSKEQTEETEITAEQLAELLEQSINALGKSFKTFVKIEDNQDTVREEKGDF